MTILIIGIDLAKDVFAVHGVETDDHMAVSRSCRNGSITRMCGPAASRHRRRVHFLFDSTQPPSDSAAAIADRQAFRARD